MQALSVAIFDSSAQQLLSLSSALVVRFSASPWRLAARTRSPLAQQEAWPLLQEVQEAQPLQEEQEAQPLQEEQEAVPLQAEWEAQPP